MQSSSLVPCEGSAHWLSMAPSEFSAVTEGVKTLGKVCEQKKKGSCCSCKVTSCFGGIYH